MPTHSILDDDQRAIDRARAIAKYAKVLWNINIDHWVLVCTACEERSDLNDTPIKDILLAAAKRHNEERHGVSA